MKLLCVTALLWSVAAAQFNANEWSVTETPEEDGGSGADWHPGHPTDEIPTGLPNRPSERPGNGNPQGPMRPTAGKSGQSGRLPKVSNRAKRQIPESDFSPDDAEASGPVPGRRNGRPRGGPTGRRKPERLSPDLFDEGTKALFGGISFGGRPLSLDMVGNRVFSPIFKVENVTFQNVTGVPLKEGLNIFLLPRGGRGPHHSKPRKQNPPKPEQYLKLIYNTTEPNQVSMEYGILKKVNLRVIVGAEDQNPEDDY